MHVVAGVEETVTIGPPLGNLFWVFPGSREVFDFGRGRVSPGILSVFQSATAGFLPFGLGGKPVRFAL